MTVTTKRPRTPLSAGAKQINLTPQGLLKILKRTDSAIRDDGHWYAYAERIVQIAAARQVLGLDRNTGGLTKETSSADKNKRPAAADRSFGKCCPFDHGH